jgi:hypothetical protein
MKHEDFGGHLSGLSKNFQPNFKVHVHPPDQDPITDDRAQTTLLALQQFARLLGLVPGRKNLIWLAGRFPIAFDPGASLSAAQVAVYPVDARGIMSVPGTRVSDLFEAGEAGSMDGDPVIKEQIKAEHAAMENFAEQTGGHAYFLTNGLKEAAVRSVENGSSYYTIGYVPRDEIVDGKLRAIKVHVENGRYELAYRRGYFASSPYHYATHDSGPPSQITKSIVHGAPEATQILFQARILPATDSLLQGTNVPPRPAGEMSRGLKEPVQHMIVDVTVDPHCLDLKNAPEGGHQTQVEFVLVAYDANGERVNYLVRALQVNIKDDSFTRVMDKGVPVRLALDLPPEQVFLRIAVYDLDASSVGSLEVPVMVATR